MPEAPKKVAKSRSLIFLLYCAAALTVVLLLPRISGVTGFSTRSIALAVAGIFLAISIASALARRKS
jgi:hypothetical protein